MYPCGHVAAITNPHTSLLSLLSQVVDVSGAAVLQAALSNCKVEVLDNCGHSVALERPRKAAKLLVDFLSAQEVSGENSKKLS